MAFRRISASFSALNPGVGVTVPVSCQAAAIIVQVLHAITNIEKQYNFVSSAATTVV